MCLFDISHSLLHCSGKTISTRFRRRTCHSQIATYDEFDRKKAIVRVFFCLIKPGEDLVWISSSWKICCSNDRLVKPEKTSREILQEVAPHREETLLGRNAYSARYGETIHDGSVKPETVDHQEEANSENFIMGSDETEFADKVKDQVRNRQKGMSNVAESGAEHSIFW